MFQFLAGMGTGIVITLVGSAILLGFLDRERRFPGDPE